MSQNTTMILCFHAVLLARTLGQIPKVIERARAMRTEVRWVDDLVVRSGDAD